MATNPVFLPDISRLSVWLPKCAKRFYSAPAIGVTPPSKQKYIPTSGMYPKGFTVGSAHVGVKASNLRFDDLALVTSAVPCKAAAMFTRNVFKAAPVMVSKRRLEASTCGIRNIIVNSGCANAVTGKGGIEDAEKMCEATDRALGLEGQQFSSSLVMSTGVIGQRLPISKIIAKVPETVKSRGDSHEHWLNVARAICTTDTFPKLISRQFQLPGFEEPFTITGITKGAGMIHPNMGTLLSVICTDAPIDSDALTDALSVAVDSSFNSISIDGDTSTNDTVICLANGAGVPREAATEPISHRTGGGRALQAFQQELNAICSDLAKLVVRDGEGATKFVTIRIRGARDRESGRAIAKMIAKSPLVKTALYGQDANWGRILCAIGYAPSENSTLIQEGDVAPEKTSVSFVPVPGTNLHGLGELKLLVNGEPQTVDEGKAAQLLGEEDLEILVRLRSEEECAGLTEIHYWTCDFSHEYVTINGDYRT